jgi:hypothetical protein
MTSEMPRPVVRAAVLLATIVMLVVVPGARAAGPVVSVAAGQLVDSSGGTPKVLQLRGVDRSGTEYACASGTAGTATTAGYAIFDGPTYDSTQDVAQPDWSLDAMRSWGINAVRIPVSDACWFGSSALNPRFSSTAYQDAILRYVRQLANHGMVAILSLHVASTEPSSNRIQPPLLLPMPDAVQGPRFWADVVQRLASSPSPRNVLYDAFNEPHLEAVPAAQRWSCWRDGCTVPRPRQSDDPPVGSPTPAPSTYATAGMQQLVSAIRQKERDSGQASRPIMLGGLDYANDLSGWGTHLPTDDADGLVASFHVYGGSTTRTGTLCGDVTCWNATLRPIVQGGRPVVAGEVGQYDCRADLVTRFTDWADTNGSSYLAWTWNAVRQGTPTTPGAATGWKCDDGPTVLKFNDGTPTDALGLVWCQRLRARAATLGAALPSTPNPCPSSRVPSEPPVDATPPTTTTPTTPTTPTTTATTPTTTTTVATTPTTPTTTRTTPATPTTPQTGQPAGPSGPSGTATPVTTTSAAGPSRATTSTTPRTAAIASKSLRLVRGRVALTVSCPAGTTPCAGDLRVRTATKVALGRRRGTFVVLSARYRAAAGRTSTVRITPTTDGRALLRRASRIVVVATAASDGAGPRTRRLALRR